MTKLLHLLLPFLLTSANNAYSTQHSNRRDLLNQLTFAATSSLAFPFVASASGGATAGKYTTIPIAKRRYYGRVQQAVHEFLELGPNVVQADMTDPLIQRFFDTSVRFCVRI